MWRFPWGHQILSSKNNKGVIYLSASSRPGSEGHVNLPDACAYPQSWEDISENSLKALIYINDYLNIFFICSSYKKERIAHILKLVNVRDTS